MSWIEQAEQQLQHHATVLKVIEVLATMIKDALVSPGADPLATLQAVERIIDAVIRGFQGRISADEIEQQIRQMLERREARDAKFDDALDRKFRGEGA